MKQVQFCKAPLIIEETTIQENNHKTGSEAKDSFVINKETE
jgi:hypothetical protein